MVNPPRRNNRHGKESGGLLVELVVAMAILAMAVAPLGVCFLHEQKLCRSYYTRAVAMEIVDGEMEILAAGEWRAFKDGTQDYPVKAESAKNLPQGRFSLIVCDSLRGKRLRLEWQPQKPGHGGQVSREALIR